MELYYRMVSYRVLARGRNMIARRVLLYCVLYAIRANNASIIQVPYLEHAESLA